MESTAGYLRSVLGGYQADFFRLSFIYYFFFQRESSHSSTPTPTPPASAVTRDRQWSIDKRKRNPASQSSRRPLASQLARPPAVGIQEDPSPSRINRSSAVGLKNRDPEAPLVVGKSFNLRRLSKSD
jgi:hypothetical protein